VANGIKGKIKKPNRNTVSRLDELPNIGKAIAEYLERINIAHPKQLVGKDAYALHNDLCLELGFWVDACVIDTFLSAIDYMEGGEPQPWWHFTEELKSKMDSRERRGAFNIS
jgi:hypothetical protein